MALWNRARFALLGLISAASGCSGGGGNGIPGAPSSPSQSSSATPLPIRSLPPVSSPSPGVPTPTPAPLFTATPTPVPTQQPSGAALTNTARPFHNADAYSYAGGTVQTFVFTGASPSPAASTAYQVSQNVAVFSNANFNGTSGAYDFKTSETDTSPLQQTGITNDTFFTTVAGSGVTNVITLGYTSIDTNGERIASTVTNPGVTSGLVDILPETGAQSWSNSGAQKVALSEASGFTSMRTYAADGTYVDTASYPQAGVANPAAAPLTATITVRSDGTATYDLPFLGSSNVTITYGAPVGGVIPITIARPGLGGASPAPVQTARVGTWYQTPLRLYDELDRDNGAVAIPAACNVKSSPYGTQANEVEQKFVRTDTALGTLESFDQLTYVVPTFGVVCVQLNDRVLSYYDYTGQSNGAPTGVSFSGGNLPLQTTTLATTIGLTSATIQPFAVGGGVQVASGMRLASAHANFLATIERQRAARQRFAVERLRSLILESNKR